MKLFGNITESLKKSFLTDLRDKDLPRSNDPSVDIEKNIKTLSDEFSGNMIINNTDTDTFEIGMLDEMSAWKYQNEIIQSYRDLANNPDISAAIDVITQEEAFTLSDEVFKIDIDESNTIIKETIAEKFESILDKMNINENIFSMARQMYVDGQLNVALGYNDESAEDGIDNINIIEPIDLYFDMEDKLWKYRSDEMLGSLYNTIELEDKLTFTESEMVHVDFGLTQRIKTESGGFVANLGYLENVLKNANLLETLENLLVPFRYSRSVSRRLFNIDVGDLPPKSANELMDKVRREFKYKKTYDTGTGAIKNIKNNQPLVEDYWMSNRSGGKGTTIDTMDERGGSLDMDDIKHAAKKLYVSLGIPDEFNPYSEDPGSFSFDDTQTTQSLMKFYIFVSRLRIPITKLLKEILRRELIATGKINSEEWDNFKKKIKINFTAELMFVENTKGALFMKAIENFVQIKESIGETVSLQTAVENTFGWSTEQLEDELQKITDERQNPKFNAFYASADTEGEEGGSSDW